jgi:methionyl-tRNA formyltransferase
MYIFTAYRPWALKTCDAIKCNKIIIKNNNDLKKCVKKYQSKIKNIFFIGWSNLIPKNIYENYDCFCYHPSDLPNYRGGSPIQHQILDGIINTKGTLFKINNQIDGGNIYKKKSLSLKGDMEDINKNLYMNSFSLINSMINDHKIGKKIILKKQPQCHKVYKRRKPEMSEITLKEIKTKDSVYLFNKIRSLQDPYPNPFIKTKDGKKLIIKKVKLI